MQHVRGRSDGMQDSGYTPDPTTSVGRLLLCNLARRLSLPLLLQELQILALTGSRPKSCHAAAVKVQTSSAGKMLTYNFEQNKKECDNPNAH